MISVPDGAALEPASGEPASSLIVLLHGYGANASDLVPLAQAWRSSLPQTAFVVPDAPEPAGGNPFGRQWFPLSMGDPAKMREGVEKVEAELDLFLDQALEARGLDNRNLALMGFSQGAMLALHIGLRRQGPIAAILAFSGVLAVPPPVRLAFPPVLLGHGAEDGLIPASAMQNATEGLTAAGVDVEAVLRPGLGHGIDEVELATGAKFLAAALDRGDLTG
ncbi:MAG: alpha/beta hydrolase [Alphaproteobacteria bacterium]